MTRPPFRHLTLLLTALLLLSTAVGAADFHPITSATTSTSNDLWAVSNLIQGPGSGFNSAQPHTANGTGSGYAWVTEAPNGGTEDYYANGVSDPVLVFDLGSNRQLNEISTWGYADTNTNGAKDFTLQFATSAEGRASMPRSRPPIATAMFFLKSSAPAMSR